METSFGNLIFTFAVESLDFTKKDAALLNAVFWGTFTVGGFAAIFIAYTKVPSSVVITVDTMGSTLSLLVMAVQGRRLVERWGVRGNRKGGTNREDTIGGGCGGTLS